MNTKRDRLREIYAYSREHLGIHTQADLSERLEMSKSTLSSAMNGSEMYLTNNLFKRICAAFPNVFNLDYLLTGEGPLLLSDVEQMSHDKKKVPADEWRTPEKIISDLEALRTDLALELQDIRQIKFELTHEREVLQQITQQLTAELHAIRGSYDIQSAPIQMVADSDKKTK